MRYSCAGTNEGVDSLLKVTQNKLLRQTFLPRDAMDKRGPRRRAVASWVVGRVSVTFVHCVETAKETAIVAMECD